MKLPNLKKLSRTELNKLLLDVECAIAVKRMQRIRKCIRKLEGLDRLTELLYQKLEEDLNTVRTKTQEVMDGLEELEDLLDI